jgi:hypothetical protein
MHSKVQEWTQHPVSQALKKVLSDKLEQSLENLLNIPEDSERDLLIRRIEQVRIYKMMLNFDELLEGELEDERTIRTVRTTN